MLYDVKSTVSNITGDGVINLNDNTHVISKATAAALTLPDPSNELGRTLVIVSATAAAHTVTGTLNGSSATGTFGAAIGNGMILVASSSGWLVVSNLNVTIA